MGLAAWQQVEVHLSGWLFRVRWFLWAAVLAVGIAVLLATTVGGVGRPEGKHVGALDVVYYYVGGSCYRAGVNPYDYLSFTTWAREHIWDEPYVDSSTRGVETGYAYPPTAAVPFWALAHLSFNGARVAWICLNAVSLAVVAGVLGWAVLRDPGVGGWGRPRWRWLAPTLLAGYALVSPYTSHNIWMGQSSLVALALLCGAWWAKERDAWLLCGVLTALATAKISMSVFFVLTLVVERRWRAFGAACACCVLLASIPLVREGPLGMVESWFGGMKQYMMGRPGDIENTENFGVRNLAAAWFGVNLRGWEAVGLAVFGVCAWRRSLFTSLQFFVLGLACAVLFVKGNDYDLVVLMAVFAACLAAASRSLAWTMLACAVFAAMAVPKRFFTDTLGEPGVLRAREVLLLLVVLGLAFRAFARGLPAADPSYDRA